jgi:hypothetical protein
MMVITGSRRVRHGGTRFYDAGCTLGEVEGRLPINRHPHLFRVRFIIPAHTKYSIHGKAQFCSPDRNSGYSRWRKNHFQLGSIDHFFSCVKYYSGMSIANSAAAGLADAVIVGTSKSAAGQFAYSGRKSTVPGFPVQDACVRIKTITIDARNVLRILWNSGLTRRLYQFARVPRPSRSSDK